jgi:hypothetical protein
MANFIDKAFAGELPQLGYMSLDQLQEYVMQTDTTRSEGANVNFATRTFNAAARRHNVATIFAREVQPDADRAASLVDMDDLRRLQESGELTSPQVRTPMSTIGDIGEQLLANYIEDRIRFVDGQQG